jgi:hypothetical protein
LCFGLECEERKVRTREKRAKAERKTRRHDLVEKKRKELEGLA